MQWLLVTASTHHINQITVTGIIIHSRQKQLMPEFTHEDNYQVKRVPHTHTPQPSKIIILYLKSWKITKTDKFTDPIVINITFNNDDALNIR